MTEHDLGKEQLKDDLQQAQEALREDRMDDLFYHLEGLCLLYRKLKQEHENR